MSRFILLIILFCLSPIFYSQVILSHSNLPIISINTKDQNISDDSRIIAKMGIIDNEDINYTSDEFNNYNGRISIEYRGTSSLLFPKKSYSIETQDSIGDNNNVSLLGMPIENDWILYAPYGDRSFIRNALTYYLYDKMGYYSPKFRFCELLLNNEYMGIYLLIEKIKRDKHRIDIEEMNIDDINLEDISGGYIIQVDRSSDNKNKYWSSSFNSISGDSIYFQYIYPKWDNINNAQKSYVQELIYNFESAIINNNSLDFHDIYDNLINVESFIDYFIISELSKNIDAYRFSTYLYKNHDDIDKRIHIGPVWDFNWAYGNSTYCEADIISGWEVNTPCGLYNPLWYSVLTKDTLFNDLLKCRWNSLRMNILDEDNISFFIDSLSINYREGFERDFSRWKRKKHTEHYQQIINLKEWINKRIEWLDNNILGTCQSENQIIDEPANLIMITDILGRKTEEKPNIVLFYIYDNGAIERKIIVK